MRLTPEVIAKQLGGQQASQQADGVWRTVCPAHKDGSPSLAVSQNAKGRLLVHCHAGCSQEDVIAALKERNLWPVIKQWTPLDGPPENAKPPSRVNHPAHGVPTKTWVYKDADGKLIGYVHRFDLPDGKKELLPMAWCRDEDGKEGWAWKSFKKPRPLYGLDLLAQRPEASVLLVEGEKTADAANAIFPDHVAVTWPGGGKAINFVDWSPLRGRLVTLWRDADAPGIKTIERVIEQLKNVAGSLRNVDLPDGLPKGWDLADPAPEGLDLRKLLTNAKDARPPSDRWIENLNDKYALVILGDKASILAEEIVPDAHGGRAVVKYLSPSAFTAFYSNQFVPVGRREVSVAKYWLDHPGRRTYRGVVFEPGIETPGYYNLWRGFSVEPDPTGEFSLFDEHIRENVAKGDESLYRWVWAFFAQLIQQPHIKPGTSLGLRGSQGTGKTIVGFTFGKLMWNHYVPINNQDHFLGRFNAHMSNALLLHADEGFWAGDPRNVGRLRGMVTDTTQRIEPKGKDSFEVNNYMRLFITGNDKWLVPAAFEERRFAVLDVGEGRMQDKAYFRELQRQLDNGGYGGLLYHLQHMDISTIDVGVIPQTSALHEQKKFSMDTVHRFWYERLYEGEILPGQGMGWPKRVVADALYKAYVEACIDWGDRRRFSSVQFGRDLADLFPSPPKRVRVPSAVNDRGIIREVRAWGYELPSLEELRHHFDRVMGHRHDWPEDEAGKELEEIRRNLPVDVEQDA